MGGRQCSYWLQVTLVRVNIMRLFTKKLISAREAELQGFTHIPNTLQCDMKKACHATWKQKRVRMYLLYQLFNFKVIDEYIVPETTVKLLVMLREGWLLN